MSQYKNIKNLSTTEYLKIVHDKMYRQIQRSSNSQDQQQAKKLEEFLRIVKAAQLELKKSPDNSINQNFPFSDFWDKASQISLLKKMHSIHPQLFEQMFFISTAKEKQILGSYLERGISQVVKTMNVIGSGKEYVEVEKSMVGNKKIQVPDLMKMTSKITRDIFNNCYNAVSKQLHSYNQVKDNKNFAYMQSVSGKIDNVGLKGDFKISVKVTKMEKDIINALKNATFTEKNYISTKKLGFGQTNPFRVFSTITLAGAKTTRDKFYQMQSCFKNHNFHQPLNYTYFYRIRALYELTGAGAKYTSTSLNNLSPSIIKLLVGSPAKYLIWNNPLGDIKVIPTINIVESLIENLEPNNWEDAMFSPIEFNQQDLKKL